MLTKCLALRLTDGFRKLRGCRDNVLILHTLVDDMLEQGHHLVVTFVDYSATFDSVSHKFIDTALTDAVTSVKSRAIFRAIYREALVTTRVVDMDDKYVQSKPFPIRRGVVQGDITSPLFFVLSLHLILMCHDNVSDKGVPFAGDIIHTLPYADDVDLLDKDGNRPYHIHRSGIQIGPRHENK